MSDHQKELILQYIDAYNNFDVAGMLQGLHDEIEFINISNDQINLQLNGIRAFQSQAEQAKDYFTERRQTITNWNFESNHTAIDVEYSGVLAIDFPNGMKAGQTLELNGKSEFYFKDHKIIKIIDRS